MHVEIASNCDFTLRVVSKNAHNRTLNRFQTREGVVSTRVGASINEVKGDDARLDFELNPKCTKLRIGHFVLLLTLVRNIVTNIQCESPAGREEWQQ